MSKEAMKLALEALEKAELASRLIDHLGAKLGMSATELKLDKQTQFAHAIIAIREALAEQPAQQEHVGWMCEDYDKHGKLQSKCIAMNPQRADPDNPLRVVKPLVFANSSPPAQRTFVGLTDEEIDKTHETQVWDARRSYARAIEAKLREKNA